jgi:hypothetical protein
MDQSEASLRIAIEEFNTGKKLCTRGAHATPGAHRRAMRCICHPTSVTPKPVARLFFGIPSEAQHARLPVPDPS